MRGGFRSEGASFSLPWAHNIHMIARCMSEQPVVGELVLMRAIHGPRSVAPDRGFSLLVGRLCLTFKRLEALPQCATQPHHAKGVGINRWRAGERPAAQRGAAIH